MNYDDAIYRGYFESLNVNELAEKPYQLEYDFSFKITSEIFPGRATFANIISVATPNSLQNQRTSLDIVNIQNGTVQ